MSKKSNNQINTRTLNIKYTNAHTHTTHTHTHTHTHAHIHTLNAHTHTSVFYIYMTKLVLKMKMHKIMFCKTAGTSVRLIATGHHDMQLIAHNDTQEKNRISKKKKTVEDRQGTFVLSVDGLLHKDFSSTCRTKSILQPTVISEHSLLLLRYEL